MLRYQLKVCAYAFIKLVKHKNSIRNNKAESSSLRKHSLESSHHFDYDNFQVISSENDYYKRMIGIRNAS